MDIGVGSFIFSQGIVSAIPLVKDPASLKQPLLPKVLRTARKCAPLLLLGVIRTLSVKGVEYPVCPYMRDSSGHDTQCGALGTPDRVRDALELFLHHCPYTHARGCASPTDAVSADMGHRFHDRHR